MRQSFRHLAAFLAWLFILVVSTAAVADEMQVWHAYRGAEEQALKKLADEWSAQHPDTPIRLLSIPYDAYANKLTSAIPRGNGPDVFIAAHERAGDWARSELLATWTDDEATWSAFHPTTVEAVTVGGTKYGIPLAYKSVVLFYNTDLIKTPPATTDDLIEQATAQTDAAQGRYGLVYQAANFYMHAGWLFGFGGQIFKDGAVTLDDPRNAESIAFVEDLVLKRRIVPEESTGVLVTQLFNDGKAAFAINGPWFLGEIKPELNYAMAPLPVVSKTGLPARPFLTVDVAFVSSQAKYPKLARDFSTFLAGDSAAVVRALEGLQPVATLSAYNVPEVQEQDALTVFRRQLDASIPMPNDPKMRSVWEPAETALRQVMRGAATPEEALVQAQRRVQIFTRPSPEQQSPLGTIVFFVLLTLGVVGWTYKTTRGTH